MVLIGEFEVIVDKDIKFWDFLRGEEEYKYKLGADGSYKVGTYRLGI
jgi:hypothetical protein